MTSVFSPPQGCVPVSWAETSMWLVRKCGPRTTSPPETRGWVLTPASVNVSERKPGRKRRVSRSRTFSSPGPGLSDKYNARKHQVQCQPLSIPPQVHKCQDSSSRVSRTFYFSKTDAIGLWKVWPSRTFWGECPYKVGSSGHRGRPAQRGDDVRTGVMLP